MKTTKTRKYLSLFMAICMLMSCLMQISAFATSIQESEMIPEGGEEELMPVMSQADGMDNHHVFPRKFRDKFTELFGGEDIIDNYLVPVECHWHRSFSARYNKKWDEFFERDGVTGADAWTYAQELATEFKYDWRFSDVFPY